MVERSEWGAKTALGLVSVLVVLVAGCLGGPNRQPAESPTLTTESPAPTKTVETQKPPSGLESVLYRLTQADNRSAFAAEHGLTLQGDRVLVVIELEPGRELPTGYDIDVRSRHENLVQAFVAVDDLVPLAEHENVSFVRTPREAVTN